MTAKDVVGKRVTVRNAPIVNGPEPNDFALKDVTGTCQFYGLNLFKQLQITIDRMPIWPIEEKDVEILK